MSPVAPSPSTILPAALFGGLVLALAGLLVAFVTTARLADRQFELARLSERQAATVSRIASLIESGAAREPVLRALDGFTGLVRDEQGQTPEGLDASRVQAELAQITQLHRLALDPARRAAFRRLASAIDRRETLEVEQARIRLVHLHRRAGMLAGLLAGVVLACAATGGWLLAKRNRALWAEVRARTRQIEAVDASRRLFFAKTSHELRTPVQAMRGQAEIALTRPDPDPAALREALEHVIAGAIALGHRIDELLGLASADNGQIQLRQQPLDLRTIVADAVTECRAIARSVESAIETTLPEAGRPEAGLILRADARWLRQGLIAVIENGLKFSPMGEPLRIVVTRSDDTATIVIADRGPGVVEADLPRIFDAFYQAEAGRDRGGNGLGLALARWVVEQHGGTIGAANPGDAGCQITIRLPLEPGS